MAKPILFVMMELCTRDDDVGRLARYGLWQTITDAEQFVLVQMQKRGVFGLKAGVAYDTQAALKRLQIIGAVEHFVKDGDNRETFRLTTRGRALLAFSTVDMETQLKRYAEYQHEENTHHKGDDASSLPDS